MSINRVLGGARTVDGQAECLEDQILSNVFGLGSGVTTEGWSSLILYYDRTHKIICPETCSYYIYYFAPIGHLTPIYPRSSRT